MSQVIETNNLSIRYDNTGYIIEGASFTIKGNEHMGIIGPNGAGKTTLALALCGLIPFEGTINIMGQPLNKTTKEKLRKYFGVVFQNPDDQLFMPIVFEDIAFGLQQFGHSEDKIKEIVAKSLADVGLTGFESRNSHHLSIGQKKRICLAAALARSASILILDEPTNELDPGSKKEFLQLLQEVKGSKIIISHDMEMILSTCDKVLLLNHKKIISHGKSEKVLSNKKLMEDNRLEIPASLRYSRVAHSQ